jgi:hypothetical protein
MHTSTPRWFQIQTHITSTIRVSSSCAAKPCSSRAAYMQRLNPPTSTISNIQAHTWCHRGSNHPKPKHLEQLSDSSCASETHQSAGCLSPCCQQCSASRCGATAHTPCCSLAHGRQAPALGQRSSRMQRCNKAARAPANHRFAGRTPTPHSLTSAISTHTLHRRGAAHAAAPVGTCQHT